MIKVRTATRLFAVFICFCVSPVYVHGALRVSALPGCHRDETARPSMRMNLEMIKTILFLGLFLPATMACAQEVTSVSTKADVETLFYKGEHAYRTGAYAEAIGYYTQVLEQDPDHLNAYLQRGFCHSVQHEYQAAVDDFSAVIARKKDHLWAYTSRGSAYGKLGKQDLALQDFNTVLQLDPKNQEAYNNRGWEKKALGDTKGACQDWNASRKMGNDEAKIIQKNNQCK